MTDEQLTAEDVTRLAKEGRHDDINQAREAGRLDRLLGVPDDHIALMAKARTGRINGDDARALAQLQRHDLIELARTQDRIDYPTGA